jgi:hypothetical protein
MTAEALSARRQHQQQLSTEERLPELTVEERLAELEGAVCDLLLLVTEGRPASAARSLCASGAGTQLLSFYEDVKGDRSDYPGGRKVF